MSTNNEVIKQIIEEQKDMNLKLLDIIKDVYEQLDQLRSEIEAIKVKED